MGNSKDMKVRRLTKNQAITLLNIVNKEPFKLNKNSLGGSLSALERNGFIVPLGRVGRNLNWELIQQFTSEEHEIIKRIVLL